MIRPLEVYNEEENKRARFNLNNRSKFNNILSEDELFLCPKLCENQLSSIKENIFETGLEDIVSKNLNEISQLCPNPTDTPIDNELLNIKNSNVNNILNESVDSFDNNDNDKLDFGNSDLSKQLQESSCDKMFHGKLSHEDSSHNSLRCRCKEYRSPMIGISENADLSNSIEFSNRLDKILDYEDQTLANREDSALQKQSFGQTHSNRFCNSSLSCDYCMKSLPNTCSELDSSLFQSPRRYPRTSSVIASSPLHKCDTFKNFSSGSPCRAVSNDKSKRFDSRNIYESMKYVHENEPSNDDHCYADGIDGDICRMRTTPNTTSNEIFLENQMESSMSSKCVKNQSFHSKNKLLPSKILEIKSSLKLDSRVSLPESDFTDSYKVCCSSRINSNWSSPKARKLPETSKNMAEHNYIEKEPDVQQYHVYDMQNKSYREMNSIDHGVGSIETINESKSDDFDFVSSDESEDFSYDENIDDDFSDTDASLSRFSSLTSPSTSTDVFTPALSFGTSSSAALTEGFDSLSIQSSSEIDFLSYGSTSICSEPDSKIKKTNLPMKSPLRPSLFPGIPPTIYFSVEGEPVIPFPSEIRHQLRWKLSTITPLIMKKTVTRAGISLTKSTTDWSGTWGKQVKVVNFKAIKSYQKVNHFPWTFQIGRKDKLWKNVWRMRVKYGHSDFHFLPQTYILPHDIKALKRAWENVNQKKPRVRHKWIIKPPASARGQGIRVIHKWSQIPKKWPLIVQKYLSNPYLINGSKFDLRLYVLVTSFDPLRIYVFDDGLVRFASVKYSANVKSLNDKFMHLTNYSINKKSASYTANEDIHACQGHKWSLKSLWKYMQAEGIDTKLLWNDIIDIIIKTVLSCETSVTNMINRYVKSQFNCYELFGFDIMLDEKLKPWLLEVNISPSLHSNSSLDASIKGQLAKDLLNLAGFHIPNRISESSKANIMAKFGLNSEKTPLCHDKKFYNSVLSAEEKAKNFQYQQLFMALGTSQASVLENLTPDDMKQLMLSEDELTRAGNFNRVFPTTESHKYHQYFENLRYYDMLLDAWERTYSRNRIAGIQRLQKQYKNFLDSEKKAETKITCKSIPEETKKIQSKKVARTVKISKLKRKQRKKVPYSRSQSQLSNTKTDSSES